MAWGGMSMDATRLVAPRAYLAGWAAVKGTLASLYPRFKECVLDPLYRHPGLDDSVAAIQLAINTASAFLARVAAQGAGGPLGLPGGSSQSAPLDAACDTLDACIEHRLLDSDIAIANVSGVQKRLAVAFHLITFERTLLAASPVQAAVLLGSGLKGSMTWLLPAPQAVLRLHPTDYLVSEQLFMGLPFTCTPVAA